MNYFEFYGLPISFIADVDQVRQKFLQLSKELHPDFYVNASPEKQKEILELSSLNTKAFETLSDFDRRMKYILQLKNQLVEGDKFQLPSDFLMEIMEMNEELLEIKRPPDIRALAAVRKKVKGKLDQLNKEIIKSIDHFHDDANGEKLLQPIKEYYYKKKYLLRISESLDSFASDR